MKKTTGCGPLPAGDRTSTNWLASRPYSTRESGGGGVRLSLSSLDTAREYRSPIEQGSAQTRTRAGKMPARVGKKTTWDELHPCRATGSTPDWGRKLLNQPLNRRLPKNGRLLRMTSPQSLHANLNLLPTRANCRNLKYAKRRSTMHRRCRDCGGKLRSKRNRYGQRCEWESCRGPSCD